MLDIKSCVKISYQGEVSVIICESGWSYQEIINQACARFKIPDTQRPGVVLTNGQGYVFEEQLLEYFLLLFPNPELLFYMRLDWQKLRRYINDMPIKRRRLSAYEAPREKPDNDVDLDYVAVPVHRQNCFIGALPTSSASQRPHSSLRESQPQAIATAALRRWSSEEALSNARPLQRKRVRLELFNQTRRSVPTTTSSIHITPLASTKRSIRI